ncbi:MAG: SufD family Fe-S cluster assembly protein [Bacilli bacterium]|nr:SufD family Fe-S cluster assembly protein [Bacilli bacterium]
MKLPKYLEKLSEALLITDEVVFNRSRHDFESGVFTISETFDGTTSVVCAAKSAKLKIKVETAQSTELALFIYGFGRIELDIEVELEMNANAKLIITSLTGKDAKLKILKTQKLSLGANLDVHLGLFFAKKLELLDRVSLERDNASFIQNLLNITAHKDSSFVRQSVEHFGVNTISNLDNNLIALGASSIAFDVSGHIAKGKHGSECVQKNRGLLLGEMSMIKVDPKLLIDEYDVVAEHGAAIGQINDDELFYLLSRGLSLAQARRLIVSGYLSSYYDAIALLPLGEMIKNRIEKILEGADSQ